MQACMSDKYICSNNLEKYFLNNLSYINDSNKLFKLILITMTKRLFKLLL